MCLERNLILYERSKILSQIRNFFLKNHVLEVETPLLTQYTVTDIHLNSFKVCIKNDQGQSNKNFWLITSPEYHMKRLLAQGIGAIYQICHSFRQEEIGQYHNSEFTMLEWYQPFYNMFDMIERIEYFFYKIFNIDYSDKFSYKDIFLKYSSIDPLHTNYQELNDRLKYLNHAHLINTHNTITDLLNLIFMLEIEPYLGKYRPVFIYHYPSSQALLSKINSYDSKIADRFEIFFKGIELGNGFDELIDPVELRKRFEQDNIYRKKNNLDQITIDDRLISALNSQYMPNCSGVAIGVDRLIMLMLSLKDIHSVLSFNFENC